MSRRSAQAASALLLVLAVLSAGSRTAGADTCAYQDPFTPEVRQALAARWSGHHLTAEVYDVRTGCRFSYQPQLRNTTASVLKIEIMAGVLRRAQSQGRGLTTAERNLIHPMITQSADPPASQLWSSLGGISGMEALDQAFAMHNTTHASPWGLTRTSAHDQVELIRQVIFGQYGPFQASARERSPLVHAAGRALPALGHHRRRPGRVGGPPEERVLRLAVLPVGAPTRPERSSTPPAAATPSPSCPTAGPTSPAASPPWRTSPASSRGGSRRLRSSRSRTGRRATCRCSATGTATASPHRACGAVARSSCATVRRAGRPTWCSPTAWRPIAWCAATGTATAATRSGSCAGSTWLLRDRLNGGPAERIFSFGVPTDIAVPGDWNGDGRDSPGVVRGTSWLLRDSLSGGAGAAAALLRRRGRRPRGR